MPKRTEIKVRLVPIKSRSQARADALAARVEELEAKLAEAEETLRAIQSGEVDAVVVHGPNGEQVFTLTGAEHTYRVLVEAMSEGAATVSPEGIVLYSNGRIAPMLHLARENIIGHPVIPLVAAADQETFSALFARALGGESCKSEMRFQAQDGSTTAVYVSLSPVRLNHVTSVCMVVVDLREHKRRDELIAAGELARTIVQHAAEAIAVCDVEGRIFLRNEALQNLCGSDPIYKRFDEVLPLEVTATPASGQQPQRFSVQTALRGGNVNAVEVVFRPARDKSPKWLLLTAGPLRSGDNLLGSVLTLTDITNIKLAEAALVRSEKLAAVGRMAATISHEINNPLAAVMNTIFIARDSAGLPEEVRSALELADGELRRIAHLTRQALGFYRESATPSPVSLKEVLDSTVGLLKEKIKLKRAAIRKQYGAEVTIRAVAGELRQVFSNLLANSLDAIDDGGTVTISMDPPQAAADGQQYVTFAVTDNGIGIPAEALSHVFEPFYTTKKHAGTGLGLWITKQLVEKHGGSIRIQSSTAGAKRGTTVSIVLLVNAGAGRDGSETSPQPKAAAAG